MKNLITISGDNIHLVHGITKNGNAIISIKYGEVTTKCIIRRGNFNSLINSEKPLTGVIVLVPNFDLPIFKTLQF